MTALLSLLAAKAAPYIIGGGAVLAAFVATYVRGRLSGAKLERQKQADAEARAQDIHGEIQNDIGALPPDAARKRLETWSKD